MSPVRVGWAHEIHAAQGLAELVVVQRSATVRIDQLKRVLCLKDKPGAKRDTCLLIRGGRAYPRHHGAVECALASQLLRDRAEDVGDLAIHKLIAREVQPATPLQTLDPP